MKKTRTALDDKVPLIGFAGAPFTLASYLIEGGGSRNYVTRKKLYYTAPEAWQRLDGTAFPADHQISELLRLPPALKPCSSSIVGPAV